MKVVISRSDLTRAINQMQGIVPLKPSQPILTNLLIEAKGDLLSLRVSDGTISIHCMLQATIIEEGSVTLPAKRFFPLMKEIMAPQIKISVNSRNIAEITTGASVFKIHGMQSSDFPEFPALKGAFSFSLSQETLKELLSKTVFAAAREDSRYTLNGVLLKIEDQNATFIGTDGKRLAKGKVGIEAPSSIQSQALIPLKAVEEIIKLLNTPEDLATILIARERIEIDVGATILSTKLLAGQYPDVDRVIPKDPPHLLWIHREELISLLKQVSLFTSEACTSARFSFQTGQLHLLAMSADVGEGRVSMPVDYAGEPLDIAFNPFFLIDILRHSKDETVRLGLIDTHNPGLITDSSNHLFVIMPMRLAEAPPAVEAETPAEIPIDVS